MSEGVSTIPCGGSIIVVRDVEVGWVKHCTIVDMIAYFRTIDDDVINIVIITCIIMRMMSNGSRRRMIIIAILIIIMSMITINIMSILIY